MIIYLEYFDVSKHILIWEFPYHNFKDVSTIAIVRTLPVQPLKCMNNPSDSVYTEASLRSLCNAVSNAVVDASIAVNCFHWKETIWMSTSVLLHS